ncbi:anti-sigma factor [Wenyingzhuangia sp. IMCC45533]
MKNRIFAASLLSLGMLLGSCSDDDDNANAQASNDNLELSISGLENLGPSYVYEGWIIVNGDPVSTGIFTVDDNGSFSKNSFEVDETMLASATKFVLSIEPTIDPDPAPSETKMLAANFSGNSAAVIANLVPGINAAGDGEFGNANGTYFLRTPTDETGTNNGNDENGIWFGTPGAPPTAGLKDMPELETTSGWRYEGWVVVDGKPLSTGTFTKFDERDAENLFSGIENAGPPIPGEDFFLNAPDGFTFPLVLNGDGTTMTVISLEPFPDNSVKPFSIKPLVSTIEKDAATAPTTHAFGANLGSFPSGIIKRK